MKALYYILCAVALATVNVRAVGSSEWSRAEMVQICKDVTGLKHYEIEDTGARNERCALDCVTKQGTIMTYFTPDGQKCHSDSGYKCIQGKCKTDAEYDVLVAEAAGLDDVEIEIIRGYVPDLDRAPGQGKSDTLVVATVDGDAGPNYKDGDILCHTHTVQDSDYPKWNFRCKPLPMKNKSQIKFSVLDSDQPIASPDKIGFAIDTLSFLLRGERKLSLRDPEGKPTPYWIEVGANLKTRITMDP